jgi:hypothetical protein
LLEKVELPSVSHNIADIAHKNSCDLGRDVKGEVISLSMRFEDFFKGSGAVSVGSQILILRKCTCSIFKFQRV